LKPIEKKAIFKLAFSESGRFQRRLLFYFGICILACLAVLFIEYAFGMPFSKSLDAFPGLAGNVRVALYALPILSLLGFLLLLTRRWPDAVLNWGDAILSALFLATMSFVVAASFPGRGFLYPFVMLLFLHATLVPSRLWVQVFLSATTVLCFAASHYFSFQVCPRRNGC